MPESDSGGYTVRLEKGGNGWLAASIDEMPGALSQGKTVASALSNLADAVRMLERDIAEGVSMREEAGVRTVSFEIPLPTPEVPDANGDVWTKEAIDGMLEKMKTNPPAVRFFPDSIGSVTEEKEREE